MTGAAGQVGTDLVPVLRRRHGQEAVIAAWHRGRLADEVAESGPAMELDVTDPAAFQDAVAANGITQVYHLATLLSAAGETDPDRAWTVNLGSLRTVLDIARQSTVERLFWPSSIAVFGPTSPRHGTPQETVLEPTTMYGVTKLAGEALCRYYALRFGIDVRSLRYPGLVSYSRFSGGGTTDYSVEMFLHALRTGSYRCFVREDTVLPLMFMEDALRATVELMTAPAAAITVRGSYNLTALSFTAGELAAAIARRVPGFSCTFEPDFRQAIADSWPATIDDSRARRDWGWRPRFDLDAMTDAMLEGVARLGAGA